MQAELDDFVRYCAVERRLAPLTCSAYERDVRACLRFLAAEGIAAWAQVRAPQLRRFLAAVAQRRPAASSQARTIAALKGFFRFCVESEYLERDPALALQAKGGRQRVVPIHPALVPLFLDYLRTRLPLSGRALFVGVQGRRLSVTVLSQTFRHYARHAGVTERKHITPHTLRHVFASELLSAGANLRQIQELLGHKHLDSTQRYTRVTAHQLRGAIKRLRWAA